MVNALEAYETIEKQSKNSINKWKISSGMTASEVMTIKPSETITTRRTPAIDKKKYETIDYALDLLNADNKKSLSQDLGDFYKSMEILDKAIVGMREIQQQKSNK